MRQTFEFSSLAARVALGRALAALAVAPPAAADDSVSIDDIRFASWMGTSATSSANPTVASRPLASVDFRGNSGQSCTTFDLNAFLRQFNPHELVTELRGSLLSAAQSEVSNYLLEIGRASCRERVQR